MSPGRPVADAALAAGDVRDPAARPRARARRRASGRSRSRRRSCAACGTRRSGRGPSTRYWPRATTGSDASTATAGASERKASFQRPSAAAEAEGKPQLVAAAPRPATGRQRREERPEVGDVLRLHPGVRGVGEGRVVVPAVRRDAAQHGVGEVGRGPAADAVGRVAARCSARRSRRTAVCSTRPPPSFSRSSPSAFVGGVAGGAAAGPEPGLAARRVAGRQRGELGRRQRARHGRQRRRAPRRRPRGRRARAARRRTAPASVLEAVGLVAGLAVVEDRLHRRREGRLVGRPVLARRLDAPAAALPGTWRARPGTRPCPPRSSARRRCAPGRRCPSGKKSPRPARWPSKRDDHRLADHRAVGELVLHDRRRRRRRRRRCCPSAPGGRRSGRRRRSAGDRERGQRADQHRQSLHGVPSLGLGNSSSAAI